jgi:hypothetical protein
MSSPPNQALHSDRGRILFSRETMPLKRPRQLIRNVRHTSNSQPGSESPIMPITFTCTECHAKLRVDAKRAGKRTRCPKCGKVVTAPTKDKPTPAAPDRGRADAPCDGCGRTFVLQTKWPPRGGLCSRCGGHYCFTCIDAAFGKTIEAHSARAEQFLLDDLDVAGCAGLAKKKVGDSVVIPTVGKDGAMPCPKCFVTTWKRELFQPESIGAYKQADHQGVIMLANAVQAVIEAHPGDVIAKLQAGAADGKSRWRAWRVLSSSTLQLSGADLSGLQLAGANLSHCDLRGAYLNKTRSLSLELQGADLSYADLRECQWVLTNFSDETRLRYANVSGGSMKMVRLQGDWTGANLSNAELQLIGVDEDVCLKEVNFTGCTVVGDTDVVAQFHALLTPKQRIQLQIAPGATCSPCKSCGELNDAYLSCRHCAYTPWYLAFGGLLLSLGCLAGSIFLILARSEGGTLQGDPTWHIWVGLCGTLAGFIASIVMLNMTVKVLLGVIWIDRRSALSRLIRGVLILGVLGSLPILYFQGVEWEASHKRELVRQAAETIPDFTFAHFQEQLSRSVPELRNTEKFAPPYFAITHPGDTPSPAASEGVWVLVPEGTSSLEKAKTVLYIDRRAVAGKTTPQQNDNKNPGANDPAQRRYTVTVCFIDREDPRRKRIVSIIEPIPSGSSSLPFRESVEKACAETRSD